MILAGGPHGGDTLPDPTPLADPGAVDLTRHAVIEAAAGTGKTYTIEHLVARLLSEPGPDGAPVPLPEILLVTFTEKAVGEMRQRIRDNLAAAFRAATHLGQDATALRAALMRFDEAQIFTIHAFCQTVLRQYAFENGEPFDGDLLDEASLREQALHAVLREEWPLRFGARLQAVLELAGYPAYNKGTGASDWEIDCLKLLRSHRPGITRLQPTPDLDGDAGDDTDRDAGEDGDGELDRFLARIDAGWADVVAAVESMGPVDPADPEAHPLVEGYRQLKVNKRSLPPRIEGLLAPVLRLVAQHRASDRESESAVGPARLHDFLASAKKRIGTFDDDRFRVLLKFGKGHTDEERDRLCPALLSLIEALETLFDDPSWERWPLRLRGWTAERVQARVERMKRDQGGFSFDDLLTRLDQALSPSAEATDEARSRAVRLRDQLRARYRYALVDEFQDTDAVQWRILARLFLDSPDHRLLLIGDPKQAIYSFRHADVQTYLEARRTLVNEQDAGYYALTTNWRSLPPLLEGFNRLFGNPAWFGDGGPIRYFPVAAPTKPPVRVLADHTGRAPMTWVDLGRGAEANKVGQRRMADFVAAECARLLGRLRFERKGEARSLGLGDICVLVRTGKEAAVVEAALAARGLAHSYYKKRGLYACDEALHLETALWALAHPEDEGARRRLLASRFFDAPPAALARTEELPAAHPALAILARWTAWAEARAWPTLLGALLADSDLLAREAAAPDGDRRLANWRQLLDDLERIAPGRDALDLAAWLVERRRDPDAVEEEQDLHRLETERPCVRIMTIHASKGLEFPVVFLAGGFSSGRDEPPYLHHDDTGRRVVCLERDAAARQAAKAEERAEEARLYYVALTRASCKLYLPLFEPNNRGHPTAGAVGTWFQEAATHSGLLEAAPEVSSLVAPTQAASTNSPAPPLEDPPSTASASEATASPKGEGLRDAGSWDAGSWDAGGWGVQDPAEIGEARPLWSRAGPRLESFTSLAKGAAWGDSSSADRSERRGERATGPEEIRGGATDTAATEAMDVTEATLSAATVTEPGPAMERVFGEPWRADEGMDSTSGGGDFAMATDMAEGMDEGEPQHDAHGGEGAAGERLPRAREQGTGDDALPGGPVTGEWIHHALETVDYGSVGGSASPEAWLALPGRAAWLAGTLRRYGLSRGGEPAATAEPLDPTTVAALDPRLRAAADWIWRALHTPLLPVDPGGLWTLARLAPADRLHEARFHLQVDGSGVAAAATAGTAPNPEPVGDAGLIHGFIDLLFRVDGRYYVLDWKSNRLVDGYGPESLARVMHADHYDLQYRLYALAALRWLGARIPGFDPARHWGGALYLFIRGLDPALPGLGVYYDPLADGEALDAFATEVRGRLAEGRG